MDRDPRIDFPEHLVCVIGEKKLDLADRENVIRGDRREVAKVPRESWSQQPARAEELAGDSGGALLVVVDLVVEALHRGVVEDAG